MQKSKGRKPKPRPEESSRLFQPSHRPESSQSHLARISQTVLNNPIAAWSGLAASVIAIVGFLQQIFVSPDIYSEDDADVLAPFAIPFAIKNNSLLISMGDTQMICLIDKILFKGGGGLTEFPLISIHKITIDPGVIGLFKCPVKSFDELTSGHIFLRAEYSTLGISRASPWAEFTWFTESKPPRWINGRSAD